MPILKIKILEQEFVLNGQLEQFEAVANAAQQIPVSQFRYNNDELYILWHKEQQACYMPRNTSSILSMPLGVEWVKATVIEDKEGLKDTVHMLVLLSESLNIVKGSDHAAVRKNDGKLKKVICQMNLAIRKAIVDH